MKLYKKIPYIITLILVSFFFGNCLPLKNGWELGFLIPLSGGAESSSIIDNEVEPGIVVDAGNLSNGINEGGSTTTFTIVLTGEPTDSVAIDIKTGSQLTIDKQIVQFEPANWDTTQTITVSAVDDTLVENAHSGIISFSITSGDANYSSLTLQSLSVAITDNDSAGVAIQPSS